MAPGAPLVHGDKGAGRRASPTPRATSSPSCTASVGDVDGGVRRRGRRRSYDGTLATQRVQHAHLETHGAIAWLDDDGPLVRAHQHAGAVPDPRRAVPTCSTCDRDRVRVFAARVGGGFGGKQEMLTEDIVALAVLRTGRPVQLEFTRERAVHRRPTPAPDADRRRAGRATPTAR